MPPHLPSIAAPPEVSNEPMPLPIWGVEARSNTRAIMPPLRSMAKPYKPLSYRSSGRREVSAFSDAPGHGGGATTSGTSLKSKGSGPVRNNDAASSDVAGADAPAANATASAESSPAPVWVRAGLLRKSQSEAAVPTLRAPSLAPPVMHAGVREASGLKPSNRSEAAALAHKLDALLASAGRDAQRPDAADRQSE